MTSMTLPPPRLLRLHLHSRRTGWALVLLAAIAAVLRASQPVTKDPGLFAQVILMLITVAAAAIITAVTLTGARDHRTDPS